VRLRGRPRLDGYLHLFFQDLAVQLGPRAARHVPAGRRTATYAEAAGTSRDLKWHIAYSAMRTVHHAPGDGALDLLRRGWAPDDIET